MVGAGSRALIERGFAAVGREVAPAHLDDLHRAFLAHYGENLCVQTKLFPGTLEALDRLEDSGFRLAVCTNKFETHSVAVLAGLGIAASLRGDLRARQLCRISSRIRAT